jgi:hypothetical protein
MFASYGDKFEAVLVNDIAKDDISGYLKGVDAVIHVAAPLPSKGDQKALLNVSVPQTINFACRITNETVSSGCTGWIFEHHPSS